MNKIWLRKIFLLIIIVAGTSASLYSPPTSSFANQNEFENIPQHGSAARPHIAGAGNLVVFDTTSSLIDEDTNFRYDVYIYNRETDQYTLLSRSHTNALTEKCNSSHSVMSSSGQVAFISDCETLVPNSLGSGSSIYWRDITSGHNKKVSVSSNGTPANSSSSIFPRIAISGNGQYVAFTSKATNLVANDSNGVADVFVHNVASEVTVRVSVSSTGIEGDSESFHPSLSYDGRFVSFASYAKNLIESNAETRAGNVFRHDLQTGITELVSVTKNGNEGNQLSGFPSISDDGQYIAFSSGANNFHVNDNDSEIDIYVKDMASGNLIFASNLVLDGHFRLPQISGNNRYIAYQLGSRNNGRDIYRFDRLTGEISKVDEDDPATVLGTVAENPYISTDGATLVYRITHKAQIVDFNFAPPVSMATELIFLPFITNP